MPRPIKEKSLENATATGAGTPLEIAGRITVSLFVVTDVDPTTLDVELEVSMDGTNFSSYQDAGGNQEGAVVTADFDDPDGNGEYAAFVTVHGLAAQYVRPRITGYGTAGNVDVWVSATGKQGSGYDYRTTG